MQVGRSTATSNTAPSSSASLAWPGRRHRFNHQTRLLGTRSFHKSWAVSDVFPYPASAEQASRGRDPMHLRRHAQLAGPSTLLQLLAQCHEEVSSGGELQDLRAVMQWLLGGTSGPSMPGVLGASAPSATRVAHLLRQCGAFRLRSLALFPFACSVHQRWVHGCCQTLLLLAARACAWHS